MNAKQDSILPPFLGGSYGFLEAYGFLGGSPGADFVIALGPILSQDIIRPPEDADPLNNQKLDACSPPWLR